MDGEYLFLMVGTVVAPTLVLLIIQAAAFPLILQTEEVTDKVCQCYYGDNAGFVLYQTNSFDLWREEQCIFLAIYNTEHSLLVLSTIL